MDSQENNINFDDSLGVISSGLFNLKKSIFMEIDNIFTYFSDVQKKVIHERFIMNPQKSRQEIAQELGVHN